GPELFQASSGVHRRGALDIHARLGKERLFRPDVQSLRHATNFRSRMRPASSGATAGRECITRQLSINTVVPADHWISVTTAVSTLRCRTAAPMRRVP